MSRKHVSDLQVAQAVASSKRCEDRTALDILVETTGQCEKVCFRAMERSYARKYLDCGVSLRTAWLTEKGRSLLNGQ